MKNIKTLLFSFIIWGICMNLQAQSMSAQANQLFDWFKKAARFDYNYPREKVYVHFDNSGYLVGDSIWYKAYVVRASSLKPTALSRVLYVELLNADGQQVAQNIHKLDSLGTANGMFSLQQPVYAGYYEVRAYTREMINWGSEACFSRILPVFTNNNPQRDLKKGEVNDIVQLSIPQPEAHEITSIINPRPYEMKDEQETLLDFYPEGGGRVPGSSQRIAYKLTDGKGMPLVSDTLNVYSSTGELYCTSVPEHEGMGTFTLGGDFETGYVSLASGRGFKGKGRKKEYTKALNLDSIACAIQADYTTEGELIHIQADGTKIAPNQLLGLAVFNRENVCYFDTLTVGNDAVDLLVPKKALVGGVCRAELFNTKGQSLSTRLFWVPFEKVDSQRFVNVDVEQNEKEYAPFTPIVVKLKTNGVKKTPEKSLSVSVAIREEGGNLVTTNDGGFAANMLLSSELKGYINRPDLYLRRNDASHRRMLDLLMLVQGWRSNTFGVMCGKDSFELKQPIEDKLILRGALFKDNNKMQPLGKAKLKMLAYRYENDKVQGETINGQTETDANGKFAFESKVDFEGDYLAQFTMSNEKNKQVWTRLTIDRWFSPKPRPLWSTDLALNGYEVSQNVKSVKSKVFEWTDTLQRAIMSISHPAEVVGERKYKGFTGNRYTWGGGEENGQRQSLKYINVEKVIERIKDMGGSGELYLFDLLKFTSNSIRYNMYGLVNNDRLIETLNKSDNSTQSNNTNVNSSSIIGSDDDTDALSNEIASEFMINGHEVKLYRNNELEVVAERGIPNIRLDEDNDRIKSMCFVMSNYMTDAVTGQEKRYGKNSYSVYLYEEPHKFRTRNAKGKEYRHIQGFTPAVKFYSPNYRKFDLPTDKDNRRTLLWNPQVQFNEQGEATVILFSNSHENQTIDISVRGITKDGQLIDWN